MLHISEYYAQRQGRFYVATLSQSLQGMFGLEASREGAMELRRMYVDPDMRGRGIGRTLLQHAEKETILAGCTRLVLSTSEIQQAALALYRSSGYALRQRRNFPHRDDEDPWWWPASVLLRKAGV